LCKQFESECRSSRLPEDSLLCLGVGTEGGGKYQTTLTVARLDELAIMSMPGEATSEVGRRLKALGAAAGFSHTIVPAYAQNHEGYILVEDDWWSGGYEPTISFWGPKFADWAIAQDGDLLASVRGGRQAARTAAGLTPGLRASAYRLLRATVELEALSAEAKRHGAALALRVAIPRSETRSCSSSTRTDGPSQRLALTSTRRASCCSSTRPTDFKAARPGARTPSRSSTRSRRSCRWASTGCARRGA
jgi:hypothetical protein